MSRMQLTAPTFDQEQYADGLVEKLRAEEHSRAERFATAVYECREKWQMSKLIDRMKRALEELQASDKAAGL